MHYMTNEHPEALGVWVVCDWDTGKIIEYCGESDEGKAKAYGILASGERWHSLVAAADTPSADLIPWESDAIAFVGVETSDKRILENGGGSFRNFPQPLMLQTETSWGHNGARIAGRIDFAEIAGDKVPARGVFDTGETGQDAERLVRNVMLNGVSVDLGNITVETEVLDTDEDGWPTDWLDHFTEWEIMGATQCAFPAFENSRIKLASAPAPEPVTASAKKIVTDPPSLWFNDPEFSEPTAIIIDDEGYLRGHIAMWGECHIGYQDSCVVPPTSAANYSFFTTGYVKCDDGCDIPTGVLTIGGGHAPMHMNYRQASAHYDDVGTGVADVAIGEDEHGIWISGAVRPGITDETLRELRASAPSGDWRNIRGGLELVAILAVNVQGFPVPRTRVASGRQQALVAAVSPHRPGDRPKEPVFAGPSADVEQRLARLERIVNPLLPLVEKELARRVFPEG